MGFRFIRTGKVSSISYKTTTARVEFDDAPGIISKPLQVLTDHTNTERNYSMPSVKENVVCVFLPNSSNSTGFILGSYSSERNLPKDTGKMKYIIFPDGTKIKYNFETHLLEIDCVGEVNISSGTVINIKGQEVNIEADSFNVTANESNFDHKINCADVITDKGSYNDHIDNLH
ncbi:MAG TPA: baseplate assembly protein [Fusobacteriaceae bacterium]|nr:baseplate assembly protein [Fusobacteriaceae bacterium]